MTDLGAKRFMAHLALICRDYPPGRDRLSSVGAWERMMKDSNKIFFRLFDVKLSFQIDS